MVDTGQQGVHCRAGEWNTCLIQTNPKLKIKLIENKNSPKITRTLTKMAKPMKNLNCIN